MYILEKEESMPTQKSLNMAILVICDNELTAFLLQAVTNSTMTTSFRHNFP